MGKEKAIHIISCYLATRKNEILFANAIWTELEDTVLREISQAQRPIFLTCMWKLKNLIT